MFDSGDDRKNTDTAMSSAYQRAGGYTKAEITFHTAALTLFASGVSRSRTIEILDKAKAMSKPNDDAGTDKVLSEKTSEATSSASSPKATGLDQNAIVRKDQSKRVRSGRDPSPSYIAAAGACAMQLARELIDTLQASDGRTRTRSKDQP